MRSFRRRWRVTVASCLLFTAAGIGYSGSPAVAATASCGVATNLFTGYGYYGNLQYEGVSANITVRNNALCTSDTNPGTNFAYTWVMTAAHGGTAGYAQSGFYHGYGQSVKFAAEDNPNGTTVPPRRTYYPALPTVGAKYSFKVVYVSSCACMEESVGGVVIQRSNFNPYSRWTQPFAQEWYSETTHPGSNVPGTSGAKTTFSSMNVADTIDGFIGSGPTTWKHNDQPRTNLSAVTNNSFSLWSS